ncbi:MAG: DUF1801 domain-containing protein [Bacteroidales bacterium]|nr:DUF1801 domain-containing protein [Bacteroidales bacterium]
MNREVEKYIKNVDPGKKHIFDELRSIILSVPGLTEVTKYGMLHYTTMNNWAISLAHQKHYVSLYVHNIQIVKKYKNELEDLNTGKSCIRFSKSKKVPAKTIRKIMIEATELV